MGTSKGPSMILMALTLSGGVSWAQSRSLPMSVNSATAGDSAAAAPASGMVTRSGNANIMFKINNTCFPTNLRSVANPLAASSTVKANVVLVVGSKEYNLYAEYPAGLVMKKGVTGASTSPNPSVTSIPAGATGAIYGNSMIFNTPFPTTVSIDASGTITDSDKGKVYVKSASFTQKVNDCSSTTAVYGQYGYSSHIPTYPCGNFMGKDGTLTASIGSLDVSSDKSNIELNVSFPGETGFCGGYWSPLMVFFDEARPRFDNVSSFPLNPFGRTSWPEANHTGYFVAIDRDGSGKIDQKNELFGDNGQQRNGFEVLKEFDTNHDGLIDKRDKDFDKLVLWQDKNGDGVSQPEELVKLSSKVVKISLNYKDDVTRSHGAYAQERQHSKFWYKTAKGKMKKSDIIDIWLAPVNETQLSQN